jgi:hypothetical protein
MDGDCYLRFLKLQPIQTSCLKILYIHWKCGNKNGQTKLVTIINNVANFAQDSFSLVYI